MAVERRVLVDHAPALGPALETLGGLDPVGIDVERADWKNYYRAAALVQVGGDGTVVLIDSLALPDLSLLQDWLADRTVVLHAAENDLVPLAALGVAPTRLHDTAVAAALVGRPTGLETLLREVLGIEPSADKQSMQRADWAARPLTDAMLDYAAGDVADLPRLATTLLAELDALGRQSWYAQELAAARALPSVEDRRDWTKLKGIGRLDPRVRAKVRALWEWREELGRTTDSAPGRIIGDAVLVDMAANPPASVRELGRRGMRRQAVRLFGEPLLQALAASADLPPEPVVRSGRRPGDEARLLADRLRALRAEVAARARIDAGVLCPGRAVQAVVASDPHSPEELRAALGLRDWQWELLREPFTTAFFPNGDAPMEVVDHG